MHVYNDDACCRIAAGKFKLQVGAAAREAGPGGKLSFGARRRYGGIFKGHKVVGNLQSLVICRTVRFKKVVDPGDIACIRTSLLMVLPFSQTI